MPALVEKLIDDLDGDLAKRRREITDLRMMVDASSGPRLELLARTCHVMAYAHWEGFVKFALRAYLEHLVLKKLRVGDLKYGLQGLTVKRAMKAASEPERTVDLVAELLKEIDTRAGEPFTVSAADVVRTGNMTSETFKSLLSCANLEYLPSYAVRENFVDSVVCGRRHRIAHGEWQPISKEEARSVAADVLSLCGEVNEQIQAAALYESYRI